MKRREPYFIAELSCNHGGSLDKVCELIDLAAESGANAVKTQTWTPGKMVADKDYVIKDGPWAGRNLYELYEEAETPIEWLPTIQQRARALGMDWITSVFDVEALHFLEEHMSCDMYKISSFELTDLRLIEAVAKTGKPIILSTGISTGQAI